MSATPSGSGLVDSALVPPTVVIALGAAVRADGALSAAMCRRVARAVQVACERPGARLLLSGGFGKRHPPGLPPEAHLMAGLARDAGMSPDALIVEASSRDTLGNAMYSLDALAAAGVTQGRLVVVTDRPHLRRALWCFRRVARARRLPVLIEGVGVPIMDRRAAATASFWETLALLVYLPRLLWPGRLVATPDGGHHGPTR